MIFDQFARLDMLPLPTPLHELSRLQKEIGCKPRIFIKRDDLTGVGMGGNKNRKLIYVFADVLAKKADTVITWAGVQSNHCRQTLGMARRLGLDCHLVLKGDRPDYIQGNQLIFRIMDAKLHFIGKDADPEAYVAQLAEKLKQEGKKPYPIHIGASKPLGTLGYMECVKEVAEQIKAFDVQLGHCFLPTGSSGTQAGTIIGTKLFYPQMKVHGVCVGHEAEGQVENIKNLVNETYRFLNMSEQITSKEISVFDQYYGEAYAQATPAGIETIKLLGRTEGILLDPVYSGKAMVGMIDQLKKGNCDDAEAVLFIHTGGFPATFAYADYFQK